MSQLPSWIGKFPLEAITDLIEHGLCGYCVLRFLANRTENLYKLYETDLNDQLFPDELITKLKSSSSYEDDIKLGDSLDSLKKKLVYRDVCTICLDICPPNKAFFAFIAQTIRSQNYEFDMFGHSKTVPASVILRQYGLWLIMKEKYQDTIPFFKAATHENNIVEIKEALRMSQSDAVAQEINLLRQIDNGTVDGDINTIYEKESEALGIPIDQNKPFPSPFGVQPLIEEFPNMHTSIHDINKNPVTHSSLSPFNITTVYYTEKPSYESDLRYVLNQVTRSQNNNKRGKSNANSMSVGGNLMRNIQRVPTDVLSKIKVIPPTLPTNEVDLNQETGEFVKNMRQRRNLNSQFYRDNHTQLDNVTTPKEESNEKLPYSPYVPTPLSGLPMSILATIDFTNGIPPGKIIQLSPYVTVQVSCVHTNVLLEGNYIKNSRMISHTSWYEKHEYAPHNASDKLKKEKKEDTENNSNIDSKTASEKEKTQDIVEDGPSRKKKKHEDLDDSEDEEEADNALKELLNRQDANAPFADSSVEAEIAWRVLPHFRPGGGKGYDSSYFKVDYSRGSDHQLNINPYTIIQFAGYIIKFHSSGREDLNVRMLGGGRPFFIELCDPHRVPNLTNDFIKQLEDEINTHSPLIRVLNLRKGTDKSFEAMVKGIAEKRKKYRCFVYCESPLSGPEALDVLNQSGDINITQLTPIRVLQRRPALARSRNVNNLKAHYLSNQWFMLDLETQAGTYVKEFVHSDRGRTFPSVTSMLGIQCTIIQLDVTDLIM